MCTPTRARVEVESDVWAPLTNVASGRVHLTLMPINWYHSLLNQ
jgi:hypothetical protein